MKKIQTEAEGNARQVHLAAFAVGQLNSKRVVLPAESDYAQLAHTLQGGAKRVK